MNRPQQALVGALAGALAVLSLHPATRGFLLRPLMPPAEPVPLAELPVGDDQRAYFLFLRAFGPGTRTTDEFLSIAETAQKMGESDPRNAAWPVVEAWAQDSLDNQEAAERAWTAASRRQRWKDVSPVQIRESDSAWDRYRHEAFIGAGFASAYAKYVGRLDLEKPGEDAARWEALQIGLTGWRSSTRSAARAAFRGGLMSVLRSNSQATSVDAQVLALAKSQLTPERGHVIDQILADRESGARRQERVAFESLLASRVAGGAMLAGVAGAAVYGLGLLLAASGKARAVFTMPWCLVIGAVIAVMVFMASGLAFPALWSAVAVGGFAVVRERVWRRELADFGRLFPAVLGVLAFLFVAAVSIGVSTAEPTAQAIRDGTGLAEDAVLVTWSMKGMSFFWLSLVLASSQVFAFVRRREPAMVAARALSHFGLAAMVIGLVLAVVLTPVGLAWDARLRNTIQSGSLLEPV